MIIKLSTFTLTLASLQYHWTASAQRVQVLQKSLLSLSCGLDAPGSIRRLGFFGLFSLQLTPLFLSSSKKVPDL